jgi:hypothetical protein
MKNELEEAYCDFWIRDTTESLNQNLNENNKWYPYLLIYGHHWNMKFEFNIANESVSWIF